MSAHEFKAKIGALTIATTQPVVVTVPSSRTNVISSNTLAYTTSYGYSSKQVIDSNLILSPTLNAFTVETISPSENAELGLLELEIDQAPPIERIYPHLFDLGTNAGKVLELFRYAQNDAVKALDSYSEPDFLAVSSQLANIASLLSNAYSLIDFNKSLGAVVSFLRRAMLATPIESIERSSLNTLIVALQRIRENPKLDLDEASDLVERLSSEGWKGELKVVESLIALLLNDINDDGVQDQQFPDSISEKY